MDFESAVEWVHGKKRQIIGKCRQFVCYTPYDLEDYMQIRKKTKQP